MDKMTVILCICAIVPMIPGLFIYPDKMSRLLVGFTMLGILICFVVSDINAQLLELVGGDFLYLTTCITPVTEELIKMLPILYFAIVFSDDRGMLLSISYALGLGFALLESMIILTNSVDRVTILWAFVRGFGATQMHGGCTAMVGRGISYVHKRRKLFYAGTLALLITAIIIHGLFNTMIQSDHYAIAIIMVLLLYVPSLIRAARYVYKRIRHSVEQTHTT